MSPYDRDAGPAVPDSTPAAEVTHRSAFHAGQKIFEEGQPSDNAYRIVSGQVDLLKREPDGDLHLAVLGPGEFFGEMDLLDESVRSLTVVALKETVLEVFDRERFLALLRAEPETALIIMSTLSRRLRHASTLFQNPERARVTPPRVSWFTRVRDFFRPPDLVLGRVQIEFKPDAIEIEERPLPFGAKAIIYTILALIASAATWASFATVDRIVTANGKLTTSANRIVMQPIETAAIHAIKVRPGQVVEKGQVLASLDWTFSRADEATVRREMLTSAAEMKRLEAQLEYSKNPDGPVPGPFSEDATEQQAQARMYAGWKQEYASVVSSADSEQRELEAHLVSVTAEKDDLAKQMAAALKLQGLRQDLYSRGLGSLTALLEAQRQVATDTRENDRLDNELVETRKKIESSKARLVTRLEEMNGKAWEQLQAARRLNDKSREQLKKQERLTALTDMRSPARAVVVEVLDRGVGAVVKEGETLVSLVSLEVPLEVEANLEPRDISYVRMGDTARIKLEAFPFQKHGTLEGEVSSISGDVVEQEQAGRKVGTYKIKVAITKNELHAVPKDVALLPGMSASAEIKVGSRRLITFFFYPIIRTLDSGLRDP